MNMRRLVKSLLLFLLSLALLPFCGGAAEEADPGAEESAATVLDEQVDAIFRRYRTRGGEVVIAKGGEIIYQRCYGYATPAKKAAATPDHYYRLASVSKLVSATAVMRLAETGRLDLDENIGTYLGGREPFFAANPRYRKTGITSRMLMSHTSCIWDAHFSLNRPLREAIDVRTAYVSSFYNDKPGTKYHYSNYAAGILGCIIEAVTGQRLNDAVSELIFEPMGLDAAYDPRFLSRPDCITTETVREYRDEIDLDNDYYHSYGGCWMKCSDLCRIGMMLCDYGMYGGRRILEESTVREMLSSQQDKGGITADSPYGLNVHRLSIPQFFPGRLVYGHQGRIDGVLCNLYFDPETRFVFAMTVSHCSPGDAVGGIRPPAYSLLKLLWNELGKETPEAQN